MISARKSTTTSSEGNPGGDAFDDHLSLPNPTTATVTRIVISYDDHLRSIAVHYADAVGVVRGTVEGEQVELELQKGEYVTAVEGACGDGVVSRIAFETSKGTKWGPYGRVAHTTFVWGGFGPGMGLLYFSGNAYACRTPILRATFATYHIRAARPTAVKYEKHIDTGPDTELPPAPMSHFATNLMSPAVKLLIGPDPAVVFHTSQDILCRLPFFRAALQGQFREASSREISMPEDEPQTVAALIEFLYTGRYAYPFRTAPEDVVDGVVMGDFPTTDLAEGAYHVSVYATAHKYGCTKLEDEARKAFVFVLGELRGVEVLRLWKCAYAKELLLKAVKDDEETRGFKNGLAELLRELFKEYATEMEKTAVEYPSLVLDLLNLVVSCE